MNQDQNLPEENSLSGNQPDEDQISIPQQEEVSENISPLETIAPTEPETENSKPQTENMEVHHAQHPTHSRAAIVECGAQPVEVLGPAHETAEPARA